MVRSAYVTDAGAAGTLGRIDLATDKTLPPITVGPRAAGPRSLLMGGVPTSPMLAGPFVGGQTGAIASTVTPVDLATERPSHRSPSNACACTSPSRPMGATALVVKYQLGQCVAYSMLTQAAAAHPCEGGPISIAIAHNRLCRRHHLGPVDDRQRDAIDLTSDMRGRRSPLGETAGDRVRAPHRTTAWVVCYGSRTLVPLSTKTHRRGAAIHLPGGPYAMPRLNAPRRARR